MMEAPPLNWRKAGPDDARALTHLGRATFLATFAVDHPGSALLDFLDQSHDEALYREWLDDPAYHILIGETPLGAPAGYAMLTPPAHAHLSRSGDIELKRIYLLPPWQGSGEAARLIRLVIEAAQARRADRMLLAVYEVNARARRFYERQGFSHIGETIFMVGDVEFPDLVYARVLTAP
jgi:ribosomal protein S18 acetylase RimI-like enzyme